MVRFGTVLEWCVVSQGVDLGWLCMSALGLISRLVWQCVT